MRSEALIRDVINCDIFHGNIHRDFHKVKCCSVLCRHI